VTGSAHGAPRRLAEALARHGVPVDIASRIEAVGHELRAAHAADGNEHAALLDAATGNRVAPDVIGEHDKVDLRRHLDAMQLGRSYVQLHSHRAGTTLSLEDFALLVFFPGVQTMVVVAVDRYWYVLGVAPGAYPAPVAEIEEAMWDAFFALRPAYAERVQRGELTREAAGRALWDEVWYTVSPGLGFLYDQVQE
jgi:NAD(P)-dependent dehydrogenase (short-subunit alcohol dehydrogenase family)